MSIGAKLNLSLLRGVKRWVIVFFIIAIRTFVAIELRQVDINKM
jgi:hypothetical protein